MSRLIPIAEFEFRRLSKRELKWIIRNWRSIDPKGGIYTFAIPDRMDDDLNLKQLGNSGCMRDMSPSQIRELATQILKKG